MTALDLPAPPETPDDKTVAAILRLARRGRWYSAGLGAIAVLVGGTIAVTAPDGVAHQPALWFLFLVALATAVALFVTWFVAEIVAAALASFRTHLTQVREFVWHHGWGSCLHQMTSEDLPPSGTVVRLRQSVPMVPTGSRTAAR